MRLIENENRHGRIDTDWFLHVNPDVTRA